MHEAQQEAIIVACRPARSAWRQDARRRRTQAPPLRPGTERRPQERSSRRAAGRHRRASTRKDIDENYYPGKDTSTTYGTAGTRLRPNTLEVRTLPNGQMVQHAHRVRANPDAWQIQPV
ncbi:MAG: hypothetical protein ACLSVD_03330 [Eggerthellaceae bacterium]